MILPQTYAVTLIVMIFGMLCLGSWASTFKFGGTWRFELYYFDFAFGVLLASLLLAFTVGSIGFDGFSFTDDLLHAGKRQWFYAFVAGVIFNFANMLLTAAVSVAGMSVAFPMGIGTAVVIGTLLNLLVRKAGNPLLLLAGCLLIMVAIAADGFAYSALGVARHLALAKAGKAKSTMRPSSLKGIILSLVSGLLMGSFAPLIQNSMEGELGLGPYSVAAVFGVGVFFSTFAFNMFFVNLAVEGDPVEIGDYFKARATLHLLGLSGGVLWALGATAALVAGAAPMGTRLSPSLAYQLSQGFAVIAALWGLLVWREFRGSDLKIKLTTVLMLLLYIGGLVLISMAPLYVRRG
jgi:glucose uptake protein